MTQERAIRKDEPARALRTRKRKGDTDPFYVDTDKIPPGMTYEWKRKSTFGQEDVSHQIHMAENGWEPVMASRHPGYMPTGYEGAIERGGMGLFERPVELTQEARAEEYRDARAAILNNENQLQIGPTDTLPRAKASVKRSFVAGRDIPEE